MPKFSYAAMALSSLVAMSSACLAAQNSNLQESELAPGYNQCISQAKNAEDKLSCIDDAAHYLSELSDKNFAAIKEQCKTLGKDASDCIAAADRAQNAYIDYYDKMAVIITYLNPKQNDEGSVEINEKLNEISKFNAHITNLAPDLQLKSK